MCFNAVSLTAACLDFISGLLCFKNDTDDEEVDMAAVVAVDFMVCDDGAVGAADFSAAAFSRIFAMIGLGLLSLEAAEDTIPDFSLDTNAPTLLLDEYDLVADPTAALPILAFSLISAYFAILASLVSAMAFFFSNNFTAEDEPPLLMPSTAVDFKLGVDRVDEVVGLDATDAFEELEFEESLDPEEIFEERSVALAGTDVVVPVTVWSSLETDVGAQGDEFMACAFDRFALEYFEGLSALRGAGG